MWLSNIILCGGSQNGLIYGWWIPYLYAGLDYQKIVGGPKLFKKGSITLLHWFFSWFLDDRSRWKLLYPSANIILPGWWKMLKTWNHSWIFALNAVPCASLPQLLKAALNCLQTCHKNITSNHFISVMSHYWLRSLGLRLSQDVAPAWNDAQLLNQIASIIQWSISEAWLTTQAIQGVTPEFWSLKFQ